jgi:hypothetical protein
MKRPLVIGFSLAALGMAFLPGEAFAQDFPVGNLDATTYSTGPDTVTIGSGVGTLAISYLPAGAAGVTSDGVFQAIGAISIGGGFFTITHETRAVHSAATVPTLQISPARVGGKGYGLLAMGTF